MKVQLFIPCFVDQIYPETGFNMIKILRKIGCEVSYNPEQTCCGQPAYNAGYRAECKSVARKFLDDFSPESAIVAPSGSCVGFVRNYYDSLFSQSPGYQLYEFSEFLVNVMGIVDVGAQLRGVGVYHDACGALRECGIKESPRALLNNVSGLEMRESPDCETCCGFGGTFAVKFEAISVGMGEQKVHNAMSCGADYMISSDLSCLMHLEGYIEKHGYPLKAVHIADVLATGW